MRPQAWRIGHPLWQFYHHNQPVPGPEAIDSTPKATRPSSKVIKQMEAMPKGLTTFAANILPKRMGGCRAWPQNLRGSAQGVAVSRPPSVRRCEISLIGRPDADSLARAHRDLTSAVTHILSRDPQGNVQGFGS